MQTDSFTGQAGATAPIDFRAPDHSVYDTSIALASVIECRPAGPRGSPRKYIDHFTASSRDALVSALGPPAPEMKRITLSTFHRHRAA